MPRRNSHWPNWSARTASLGLDFGKFWTTYENWKTGILHYFDGRYTSAAVEGINNKARVITKRCYGVKLSNTLWSRLKSGPEPRDVRQSAPASSRVPLRHLRSRLPGIADRASACTHWLRATCKAMVRSSSWGALRNQSATS